ncbi:MAG: hydrogenase maturation protease [Verrucomicrobiales bacterium]|nr:hydrogenase maturation protease [Verrucomicrobiales bacterium]MCP5527561.1 hydrogenase maturation protease [Verrucomicrobiales bacterium]
MNSAAIPAATTSVMSGSPLPFQGDPASRTLVLGLGNDILSDDAVGLLVARELQGRLPVADAARCDVVEVCEMGLALLDVIVGYRDLIIVDSIQTGRAAPGTLHEFQGEQIETRRVASPHFLGVGETLALGRLLGLAMPETVRILAIEVADPFTLGTKLTPAVAAATRTAVSRLKSWLLPRRGPFRAAHERLA